MRFKVDENLPEEVAVLLRAGGHDALTALEEYSPGAADPDISEARRRDGRALVTSDLDFADIRAYPPGDYPGPVALRLRRQSKPRVLRAVARLLPVLSEESLVGTLRIAGEDSVRVRE